MGDVPKMIKWTCDPNILRSPAITNRDLYAIKLSLESDEEIISRYAGLNVAEVKREFGEIFSIVKKNNLKLEGVGIELGAGLGVLSATMLNHCPDVKKCYALEIVPKVVELLQPRTVKHIAKENSSKVVSVLGSFDNIEVPDGYFDFCIEYASLHHSDNLINTLNEVARSLKSGAPLVAIDRAHINEVSADQLQLMLNVQYTDAWKSKNGYSNLPLSRAENGEHEIRIREWMDAFFVTGFDVITQIELRPVSWHAFKYKIVLLLPFRIRKILKIHHSRVRPSWREIFWMLSFLLPFNFKSGNFMQAAKEHTLFIARKR